METISVIIPVYNVEKYLHKCLDSVVGQTYRDLEIILVDDGSPDACGVICDEYARRDSRVQVIHKRNAGVSAARNDGIQLASGKWLAFVDSDDWCETDYYENMMSAIGQRTPDILIAGGYYEESSAGVRVRRTFEEPFTDEQGERRSLLIAKTMAWRYGMKRPDQGGSIAVCWNKIYRTAFLREARCTFDETLHPMEDILFHMHAFMAARTTVCCDCIGYHYLCINGESSVHRFRSDWPRMFDTCADAMADKLCLAGEEPMLWDAYHAHLLQLTGMMLRCYFFHPDNALSYAQEAWEVRSFKSKPYIREALRSDCTRLLSPKQKALKILLKQPLVWPLYLAYAAKKRWS